MAWMALTFAGLAEPNLIRGKPNAALWDAWEEVSQSLSDIKTYRFPPSV